MPPSWIACGLLLVDLVVDVDEHAAAERVDDPLERDAADDAVAQRLDDLAAFDDRPRLDAVHRAAIDLVDDDVLRDVDESARQVARVRGLERGVGQTLAGAVRGDEVLHDRQAFTEVRVIGVSMISPDGLAIRPRMPASWRICCFEPRAPESAMM